jgi:hypothetical protein
MVNISANLFSVKLFVTCLQKLFTDFINSQSKQRFISQTNNRLIFVTVMWNILFEVGTNVSSTVISYLFHLLKLLVIRNSNRFSSWCFLSTFLLGLSKSPSEYSSSFPASHTYMASQFLLNEVWTIGVLGVDSRRGPGVFLFTTASRMALEPTQPPIKWVLGTLSLGVKRPEREADHSPPSSFEVRNELSYTSTFSLRLHGVVFS